eukprot:gene42148-55968_t
MSVGSGVSTGDYSMTSSSLLSSLTESSLATKNTDGSALASTSDERFRCKILNSLSCLQEVQASAPSQLECLWYAGIKTEIEKEGERRLVVPMYSWMYINPLALAEFDADKLGIISPPGAGSMISPPSLTGDSLVDEFHFDDGDSCGDRTTATMTTISRGSPPRTVISHLQALTEMEEVSSDEEDMCDMNTLGVLETHVLMFPGLDPDYDDKRSASSMSKSSAHKRILKEMFEASKMKLGHGSLALLERERDVKRLAQEVNRVQNQKAGMKVKKTVIITDGL